MRVVSVLSIAFFSLVVLDCVSTAYGLAFKRGLAEANGLVRAAGLLVSSLVKMALTVLAIGLWRGILDVYGGYGWVVTMVTVQALAVTLVYLCVVLNNLILILAF
jgi:hypothetical protein